MDILDQLRVALLTETQINALSMYTGAFVYDSTNKKFIYFDGTDKKPIGSRLGVEGFQEPTTIYPFQMESYAESVFALTLQSINRVAINTSPMVFEQDVKLQEIQANLYQPSGGNFTAPCAVYELNSKATTSGINYFEYTKVEQFTPVFNWINGTSSGLQTLTITPNFVFKAGKTYVVISMSDKNTTGQSLSYGARFISPSKLLGITNNGSATFTTGRALLASTTLPAPYTLAYSHPTLPSTIWFQEITVSASSYNPLSITVQNA